MAGIVAPRRGEPIVGVNGIPTLRFLEYLEKTATQTNETVPDTEIDVASINLALGQVSELSTRVGVLELLGDLNRSIGFINDLAARLQDAEINFSINLAEPGRV